MTEDEMERSLRAMQILVGAMNKPPTIELLRRAQYAWGELLELPVADERRHAQIESMIARMDRRLAR